jgi:trehalose utilization protein
MKKINVTVWHEFRHEKHKPEVRAMFPEGIHMTIKSFLDNDEELNVRTATLDEPECGLPDEVLDNTDVLIWWGHTAHREVPDELIPKIQKRVYQGGMGFIALHSAHFSKPFKALLGTNGNLSWGRNQREVIWNVLPSHPITKGLPDHFTLESEELYCEPFYIPQPDELVFNAWYEDGYVFRAGSCWHKGAGKVFYFQPGHETCRSFYNPYVRQIITNAVHWAAPNDIGYDVPEGCVEIKDSATNTPAVYVE